MIPSPGRIVHYTLDANDVASIQTGRGGSGGARIGNPLKAGDVYPLVITRCWGDTEESSVNGQVLLDGNDTHWVTSVQQGDGERQWREPARVPVSTDGR